jgi:hypothetical protein
MQQQLNKIEASMQRIEDAIAGNDMGNKGLAKRLEEVETKADYNKKTLTNIKSTSVLYGTGAGTGISAIILAIKAWWTAKIGG